MARSVPILIVATLFGIASAAPALAQSSASPGSPATPGAAGAGATPNLAPTGQHMPDVGRSTSAGVTPLDRKQGRKMSKETTICKGC